MFTFLYNLIAAYIIPGMMLAFSLCLFFLYVPKKEELKNYVFARKVMGTTFLVYCLALICEAMYREPLASDLLNSMIVIAIGATQAFLFTFSLIALLNINFLTKRTACRETLTVATFIAAAFTVFAFCPPAKRALVFYAFSFWYIMLMARYIVLFRRYYKCYHQRMDNYFSDDERKRLQWVPVAFYSASAIGIAALLFAWLITPLTQLLFMFTAVVYYSVFAIRFMNYVHVFPKIETPLLETADVTADVTPGNAIENITTEDDQMLMVQIEKLVSGKELYKKPDLSIANVAALCGKSHRVVSMAINHCQGVNFKTYINEYRVNEAVKLIDEGWLKQHTLDALALETGFASRVNLYRAFKRKTGMSPTDWIAKKQ